MVLLAARLGLADGDADALDRLVRAPAATGPPDRLPVGQPVLREPRRPRRARRRAERSLELADDARRPVAARPWSARSWPALTMQVGDLDEALGYAVEAIPVMEALGATEDVAQLKAVLAMSAMADGRFAEAEPDLRRDRAEDDGAGSSAPRSSCCCGRPELDLAAGRIEEGLRGYRDAVARLTNRPIPGLGAALGLRALDAASRRRPPCRRTSGTGASRTARRPARRAASPRSPSALGGEHGLPRLPGRRLGGVRAGRVGADRRPTRPTSPAPYACSSAPTSSATTGSCPA